MKTTDEKIKKKNNKRTSKEHKTNAKKLTSRIVVGVSVALSLIFIVFIFVTTNFMGNESIVTQTAINTTVAESINTTGFVIRDEELVDNNSTGVLVYQVSSGDKITTDGTIATIYSNETDAVNYQNICELEQEIAELEALNNVLGSSNVGLDSVNNRLDQKLVSFIKTVNERDFANVSSSQGDLLSAIYRKQIITGDQKNFDSKIEELKKEKDSLVQNSNDSIDEIKSKESGYFVSSVDGYENKFSINDLSEITYSDINNVTSSEVDESKYIGKVLKGVNWYIACPVTHEQATAISHNDSDINIKIPYATSELIPAKVFSVNNSSADDMSVVILECNYMSPALSQIRNESVEIQLNTYEGLKVPRIALHDDIVTKTTTDANGNYITQESKVQGVYVKYGSELIFKQVYVIYSDEDYVICSENPDDDLLFNGTTLMLYDEVVVEGDNLYNGKLID